MPEREAVRQNADLRPALSGEGKKGRLGSLEKKDDLHG